MDPSVVILCFLQCEQNEGRTMIAFTTTINPVLLLEAHNTSKGMAVVFVVRGGGCTHKFRSGVNSRN